VRSIKEEEDSAHLTKGKTQNQYAGEVSH